MADYDLLVAEANRFRVEQYKPTEAIEKYKAALAIGGPKDREIKQMIGVCFQLKHEYRKAIDWYHQALEGADDYETGNILRDLAESHGGLQEYGVAFALLFDSLDKLPYTQYPSEHAASLGFLARTELRMGKTQEAVRNYGVSDVILSHENDQHAELYNKLHYANALSRNGQWVKSRLIAVKGFKLALKYGANLHRFRAVVLMLGGYKLDDYFRSKLHR